MCRSLAFLAAFVLLGCVPTTSAQEGSGEVCEDLFSRRDCEEFRDVENFGCDTDHMIRNCKDFCGLCDDPTEGAADEMSTGEPTEDCEPGYDMTGSSQTLGGVCFDESLEAENKQDCLCACADDETCTAVDWNTSDTPWQGCRCWFHTQEITEANIKANENVNQWKKKASCEDRESICSWSLANSASMGGIYDCDTAYMMENCTKTCGLCDASSGESTDDVPPGESTDDVPPGESTDDVPPGESTDDVPPEESTSGCEDIYPSQDCAWALTSAGGYDCNHEYLMRNCKKTCGLCEDDVPSEE